MRGILVVGYFVCGRGGGLTTVHFSLKVFVGFHIRQRLLLV